MVSPWRIANSAWNKVQPLWRLVPAVGQLIHWWPTLWPYVAGLVMGGLATASAFIGALSSDVQIALAGLGVFSTTAWTLIIVRQNWRKMARSLFRRGVSLNRIGDGLNVATGKSSVGFRRDLVDYGPVDCRVQGVELEGFNFSYSPISVVKVRAQSLKTNQTFEGLLDSYRPECTYGIPPRSEFRVSVRFPNSTPDETNVLAEGQSPDDFRDFIGSFDVIFEYDGRRKSLRFPYWISAALIEEKISQISKGPDPNRPRVMPK